MERSGGIWETLGGRRMRFGDGLDVGCDGEGC